IDGSIEVLGGGFKAGEEKKKTLRKPWILRTQTETGVATICVDDRSLDSERCDLSSSKAPRLTKGGRVVKYVSFDSRVADYLNLEVSTEAFDEKDHPLKPVAGADFPPLPPGQNRMDRNSGLFSITVSPQKLAVLKATPAEFWFHQIEVW